GVGHIQKTNLTTGATTNLHTGDWFAGWQGLVLGSVAWAVGEEKDGGAHFRASLYRIVTGGVTQVLLPNSDDCNEFIGLDTDGTYLVAGERATGGANDSNWPMGL
ncbi:unnamed protein product, partial [marine sediment metagenome]